MDPSARIQGVPLKTRGSFRKESFSPISPLGLQTLVRSRKELCTVVLELHGTEAPCLTEIHFVCLPSQAEGDHFTLQALPSVPAKLLELLKSLHVHSLTDEEVLLLEESKKLLERNRSVAQTSRWSRAACVLRRPHSPSCSTAAILALLSRYMAGFRYALELQALHRSVPDGCQAEDDDTNQSVSSIEDDFVTALEHLEKDDATDNLLAAPFSQRSQRDAASQTVPSHRRDGPESSVIISSRGKGSPAKPANRKPCLDVSVSVQSSVPAWASGPESQWSFFSPSGPQKGHASSAPLTESEESDCSSPSPVIFLDEVGYQKSLEAKLDIPKIPVLKGGVEDSDSEVSEFFDSFDRFDDLDQAPESTSEPPNEMNTAGQTQKNTFPEDCTSKPATTAMNPHRFDHPVLPANIKKPTPLKPGSPYGSHPDIPDSPRPIMPFCEESGALFSPVQPSAFSPMGEGASMEHLGRADEECSELHKPQDLCTLYKKYSDFASNISKEILSSVCGYSSPVDMNVNKNLSCVCHKEFTNSSGHLMRLSEIQEAVTVSQSQKPHTLKEGIQKFATDLVEMSLGSAFRDLQKGVATCTTTLCHLAARLTSSVFQMAFQEIGARHAYVLKEHAVNGLAGFLVGEAVSGALKEFHFVKKQIFNNAVARFAADLAEELVFEGIMEVCQFSHPSTPLTPSDWSFQREEEVVSAYASDLSESVLQEAFIELSQADVTFTTEAAISVSLDNIRYVSAEDTTHTTKTCNAATSYFGSQCTAKSVNSEAENGCTVGKALFCMSGIASCIPVPAAGKGLSQIQSPTETCQYKSSICRTSQTSPRKSNFSEQCQVMTSASGTSAAVQTNLLPPAGHGRDAYSERRTLEGAASFTPYEPVSGAPLFRKDKVPRFSGNMWDTTDSADYKLTSPTEVKKRVEGYSGCLSRKTEVCVPSVDQACSSEHTSGKGNANMSLLTEHFPQEKLDMYSPLPDSVLHQFLSEVKCTNPHNAANPSKQGITDQTSLLSTKSAYNSQSKSQGVEVSSEMLPLSVKDSLEVPSFELAGRGCKKFAHEELLHSPERTCSGDPGTPPSTPQQGPPASQEKQIKQFSKKLKSKLAKEFSPATPPPTPRYQPFGAVTETGGEAGKADFILKLMRSLSDEAGGMEDVQDSQEYTCGPGTAAKYCQVELNLPGETDHKMVEKGALCYAGRLASHIVSMATEMDNLGLEDGRKFEDIGGKDGLPVRTAQFSEETLNSLWAYAGEIAGEVISDVMKMTDVSHCRHRALKRTGEICPECHQHVDHRDFRLTTMVDRWSSDLLASVISVQSSELSGHSSGNPNCESVKDEDASYLIRVLQRGGGQRELILDQYASHLAYRSIRAGLAQAEKRIKQRSNLRLNSFRGLHHNVACEPYSSFMIEMPSEDATRNACSSSKALQCAGQETRNTDRREYMELVVFAESLAYNIICDVTRKLRPPSVRLPKSLTDSCLYKKSTVEDTAKNLGKPTCLCSSVPHTEKPKQYHSTGSLNDENYSDGIFKVIEHYARKIVDDTLELTVASSCPHPVEDRSMADRNTHAHLLSEGTLRSSLADQNGCYRLTREHPFCNSVFRHEPLEVDWKRSRDYDVMSESCCNHTRMCGFEIPEIHIDSEKRAEFAEAVVSSAIEKARRDLSNSSLNTDSGIGHDGPRLNIDSVSGHDGPRLNTDSGIRHDGPHLNTDSGVGHDGARLNTDSGVVHDGPRLNTDSGIGHDGPRLNTDSGIRHDGPRLNADSGIGHDGPRLNTDSGIRHDGPHLNTDSGIGHDGPRLNTDSGIGHDGPRLNADSGVVHDGPRLNTDSGIRHDGPRLNTDSGIGHDGPRLNTDSGVVHDGPRLNADSGIRHDGPRLNTDSGIRHDGPRLNTDSGVGHDGASFAESLATEIMASVLTNVCQTINISPLGRERTHTLELLGSQGRSLSAEGRSLSSREDSQGRTLSSGEDSQGRSLSTEGRSLSSGEDSLGSWSNLSLEDEHLDESSSFLHLSDSNGNSSSWSSLGLEGEEPVSLSPSNSDGPEEKEAESAADVNAAQVCPATVRLLVLNSDLGGPSLDPQVRAVLQWIAASHSDLPTVQLGQSGEVELQQLPAVLCRVRQRGWTAGDLLQALLQYCEGPETQPGAQGPCSKPFFHWLLEHA
ncbi:A-kinase anchor protein 11-like isoform X1 [Anguilla anguilla]|uniref:A-kinase anchor protein 11-like isoform X1 n=1 Tax=Anguilla anguilla TaxID=7936 RepID=UPI0015B37821|nr:A-kinase anchor protein 11-like isoform X1 [Anguilla anguilla]